MNILRYPDKSKWAETLQRPVLNIKDIDLLVTPVIEDVQKQGDHALKHYTEKFDHVQLNTLAVTKKEFDESENQVDEELKKAIQIAIHNIEAFHSAQQLKHEKIVTLEGVTCWQKSVAIQKVGLYVPGGSAPLFSTVLMLAIPARIAGCKDIILCSPPNMEGKIHPAVLYAAKVTGVTQVFKIGGAQAIAAMAYGTESVPKVYKIFGPGNQFVTAAKQIVSRGAVAIDMPAGPSEVAVIADDTSNPSFVASDLLSQAEHGADSQVLLFTTSETMADKVFAEVMEQVEKLPRKEIALKSLQHSRIIVLKNKDAVMEMVNEYAPEHLIISTDDASRLAEEVVNAGSVFIGPYASESAGDYASGTNHTLPTNGYAKAYNGVNLDAYVKKITFQELSFEGLKNLGPSIMKMAETEELIAHRNAVSIRINK